MLLSDHFVFVHMPKTAGRFVTDVLMEHAPASWNLRLLDGHPRARETPASHAGLPRLGFVRNPYAWYVSWYVFHRDRVTPFFDDVSRGGTLDFGATIRNAMRHPHVAEGPPGADGPLSLYVQDHLGPGGADVSTVGKTETVRQDLLAFLRSVTEVPAALAAAIEAAPRRNATRHAHYSTYYDDELRELVWQKDRRLFELCGYRFERPDEA